MTTADIQASLSDRFLRYSAIATQSVPGGDTVPTSPGQWELAKLLARELTDAGASDVHLSDTAVVTAKLPATTVQPADAIGFCTHLDTVDVNLSPQVKAHVVEFDGVDFCLNADKDIWFCTAEHPEIAPYVGQKILVTDGTSVLGADDKAGIAAVMEAATRLLQEPSIPHGDVYLSFVPDEEIGLRGVRTMDLDRFPVDYAYTLDCCELGEVVNATFNAGTATLTITGVTVHPMNAKGTLVNPILIAQEFIARLDPLETPEHTEGREGYIWVNGITGNQLTATVTISIRDHDRAGYEAKKERIGAIAASLAQAHPRATVELEIEDVYANLADAKTVANAHAVDHIYAAMKTLGITPKPLAMRGGTDGSWLSTQGIYTPNFFTGAHNFHSPFEFLPLDSFEQSYLMVRELIARAVHPGP